MRNGLENEIFREEVLEAIYSLSSGKSPGLDWFPVEFLKTFLPKLIDPLLSIYNHSTDNQTSYQMH